MGAFTVPIEIGDPDAGHFEPADALVDTGASHTVFPASTLRRLGVQPREQGRFQLANGTIISRDVGQTWVHINGRPVMTIVVFTDEGARPLLGTVTLEELRLGVDPVAQRLIDVPAYLT